MPMTGKKKKGRGVGGRGGGDENKAEGCRVGHFYWAFSSGVTSFVNTVRNGPCLGMIAIRFLSEMMWYSAHCECDLKGGGRGGVERTTANSTSQHSSLINRVKTKSRKQSGV